MSTGDRLLLDFTLEEVLEYNDLTHAEVLNILFLHGYISERITREETEEDETEDC